MSILVIIAKTLSLFNFELLFFLFLPIQCVCII